jgi:ferredoxin
VIEGTAPLESAPAKVPQHAQYEWESSMAKLTVEGVGEFDIPAGKRLVLALEQDAGIDQLHACGGHARCTTCRVEFIDGEPNRMTVAERDVLKARGLAGVRLSCQILCDHDMAVRAISRLAGSGRKDAGSQPAEEIEPPPVWIELEETNE